MQQLYNPRYLYLNGAFVSGQGIITQGNKILDIGPCSVLKDKYPSAQPCDWSSLVLIPGTVNVHNHCFQSILRGLSCDRPFLEWRDNALYKFSNRFSQKDIYNAAVFAFGEMMKYGVTTVCDFFYLHQFGKESDKMIIQAAKDVGIRLVLSRTMYDWDGAPSGYVENVETAVRNTEELMQEYNSDPSQMTKVLPAPHSLHAASPEMVIAGHALAKKYNCGYHIHVAEEPFEVEQVKKEHDGLTPVEFLDSLGVVDDTMTIVHGVWLKDSEIDTLGKAHAHLAYCPSSNMFLADGITDIPHMRKAGVQIGLGSDGACSNNRISIFEEMRMTSLLQKANTCDAMCLNYNDVFNMGTKDGASLLGLPAGEIKPGYLADFVGISIDDISMQPISDSGEQILPNIVYSMQPSAIRRVVVNGKLTVNDCNLLTITEPTIVNKVRQLMKNIGA